MELMNGHQYANEQADGPVPDTRQAAFLFSRKPEPSLFLRTSVRPPFQVFRVSCDIAKTPVQLDSSRARMLEPESNRSSQDEHGTRDCQDAHSRTDHKQVK